MIQHQDYDFDWTREVEPTVAYLDSLLKRVESFCEYSGEGDDVVMKLRMMTLTMELESFAKCFAVGRKRRLSKYFENTPPLSLQECLSRISQIDELKSELVCQCNDMYFREVELVQFPPLTTTRLWNSPEK